MTERDRERVQVLIVQLQDRLFIFDTVLNETVFVLVEGDLVQKGADLSIFISVT